MESVAVILTSPNAIISILGLMALICLLAWLSSKGIFSVSKGGLHIGKDMIEKERDILLRQQDFIDADCSDMIRDILQMKECKNYSEIDKYKIKYTVGKISSQLYNVAIRNNICLSDEYISRIQSEVWGIVSNINPEPKWNFLEAVFKDRTKDVIKELYNIRHTKEE